MSITFYADIKDEITGVVIAEDLPCEIEAYAEGDGIRIDDITVDGKSLYSGTDLSKFVAAQVAEQALADADFVAAVIAPWGAVEQRAELGTWF